MYIRSLALTLIVCGMTPAAAQLVPLADEIQVNSYTTNDQDDPAVAADPSGKFVVVWASDGGPGADSDETILAQRYGANGTLLGLPFQVNSYATGAQNRPAVAADPNGAGFVVMWASYGSSGNDNFAASIQGRRFTDTGVAIGSEFQVNTYTTSIQQRPAVARVGDAFVGVWDSLGGSGSDGSAFSVQGQMFTVYGAYLSQFQVNTYATGSQRSPAVAINPSTLDFIVVWDSEGSSGSDASDTSIQGQLFSSSGSGPIGPEFQINGFTFGGQYDAHVATDAVGNFVVVWTSFGSGGSDTDSLSVHARRFDAGGNALGPDFQVNTYTSGAQLQPDVAVDSAGNFVVSWASYGSGGSDDSGSSIHAQRYDPSGTPVGGEFQVNNHTSGYQLTPSIAADAAGNLLVAWRGDTSDGSDSDGYSVHRRRLAVGRTILGKKILVKNPNDDESKRVVIALGKENGTDIGAAIVGDPTVAGADLRVITNGTTDSNESYFLDPSGWSAAGSSGWQYAGPTFLGDPVRKVLLKRTPAGSALLKVILKGNVGTQSLDVLPPNLGDEGGLILSIADGGTYCAAFGGAAAGSEIKDDAGIWKVINPSAEGCPSAP